MLLQKLQTKEMFYWQDLKNLVEQIPINFGGFPIKFRGYQDEFGTNCAVGKHTKLLVEIRLSVDIQKLKYRWTDILVCL